MPKSPAELMRKRVLGAGLAGTEAGNAPPAGSPRASSTHTPAGMPLPASGRTLASAGGLGSVGRLDVAAAGALVVLAGIALGPLWRSGIPAADDLLATLYRVFALHEGWKDGNLYPALSADLAFGYSAPLFLYYAPLATYIAELFHVTGLGFIAALKASYLLALCVSGWGMYAYGREVLHTRRAAFLAAVAYLLAPYQLLNIFKRAALAEIVALALLPWVLWTLHALYLRGGRAHFVLLCLSLAGLIIANNSIALFALPAIVVYLAALFLTHRILSRLWLAGAALALGSGLSAFFWLPAIAERSAVKILPLMESFADPTQHLLALPDLVQRSLTAEYWNGQTPTWALIPALLALCGVLTLRWQPRGTRQWLACDTALIAACLLLQLRVARDFWTQMPLVGFIQFPWRLLGFVSLAGALLIGSLANLPLDRLNSLALFRSLRSQPARLLETHRVGANSPTSVSSGARTGYPRLGLSNPEVRSAVSAALPVAFLVALLAFASLARLWPGYVAAWTQGHYDESAINRGDMYERGRGVFELFSDYQPAAVQVSMAQVAAGRIVPTAAPALASVSPPALSPKVHLIGARPLGATLRVQTLVPLELSFHYFFVPGWRISIDRHLVTPHAQGPLGLLAATVPGGTHIVNIDFANTPLRQLCSTLSVLCLLIWVAIALRLSRHRQGLALATVLVVLLVTPQRYGGSLATQGVHGDTHINVGADLQLVGYQFDRPAYHAGDSLEITLFWLGLRPPERDYKVFVHLRDAADTRTIAQHDGQPVYGFTPTTRIEAGEILADTHVLPLAKDLAPGSYQLVTGLYDPQTMLNLPISGASPVNVLPTDRLSLAPVEILPNATH